MCMCMVWASLSLEVEYYLSYFLDLGGVVELPLPLFDESQRAHSDRW